MFSLLISFIMSLALSGLNVTMRIPQMTTNTPTINAAPINNQSSASSQDNDTLPNEIRAEEAKVADATESDKWARRTAIILLLLYVIVTGAVAGSTVWNNRTTSRLRAAENLLNDLQKEKIRADSARKTEVETQKVREEAASQLTIKTEEVRGEAKEKIEAAKGEAQAKIEQAKAEAGRKIEEARIEAARQIGLVQKDVAQQQQRAVQAEKDLLDLRARIQPRTVTAEQRTKFLADVKNVPKGNIKLVVPPGDLEVAVFAKEIFDLLTEAGWKVEVTPHLVFGVEPIGLCFLLKKTGHFTPDSPLYHFVRLEKAFEAIDLDPCIEEDERLGETEAVLRVGHKPLIKP
jgi:hypothetical protein